MDWSGIQTAILDVERRRLGLPSREALATKRAIESRAQAAHESQMESADLQREQIRQNMELQPELTDLRARTSLAQAEAARARAEQDPRLTGDAYLMSLNPEQAAELARRKRAMEPPKAGGEMHGRPYPAMIGGKLVYVDPDTRQPIEGMTPPPTAEMRNTDYQSQALTPAFESMKESLNVLKGHIGGFTGAASAAIPGTDAYWAKSAFVDKTKALAGAITARMAGEGSRLSDEDRVAYSRASAIVDNMILLPGGVQEAERRLTEVQQLLEQIQARRNRAAGGFDTTRGDADPGGGAITTVRSAAEYNALPSGTVYFDPNGKRRRKP